MRRSRIYLPKSLAKVAANNHHGRNDGNDNQRQQRTAQGEGAYDGNKNKAAMKPKSMADNYGLDPYILNKLYEGEQQDYKQGKPGIWNS